MSMEGDRKVWVVIVHTTFSVYTNDKDEIGPLIGNTYKENDPNVDIQKGFIISIEENPKTFNQIKKEMEKKGEGDYEMTLNRALEELKE